MPPVRRRPQQVRDRQVIAPALEERLERLDRILDLIRLDDAIMVGVERLDDRRRRPPIAPGSTLPSLAALSTSLVLSPGAVSRPLAKCRAGA
jgi:hypothetical protein